MNIRRFLMGLLAVAVLGSVMGCRIMAIKQVDGHPIPSGLGQLTMEQVESAIVQAGGYRGWVIKPAGPGKLIGTLEMHDKKTNALKHVVVVDITYSTQSYSIHYKSSEHLKYDAAKGMIHGSYNRWVENLVMSIDSAIRAL